MVYIDEAFHRRVREGRITDRADIVAAHADGTIQRLRPKLMTVTTMAAGLLPFLWADGPGAEVMKRVAAPMLGGLASSAFLTLEVLPVIYTVWRTQQLHRAQRRGVPIATIVGTAPWSRRWFGGDSQSAESRCQRAVRPFPEDDRALGTEALKARPTWQGTLSRT